MGLVAYVLFPLRQTPLDYVDISAL